MGWAMSTATAVLAAAIALCPASAAEQNIPWLQLAQGGVQRPAAPMPAVPDQVVLSPQIFPVGKWPEGIAFDGRDLWVAESGQRTVARINPDDGRVVDGLRVGRLPVDVVADPATGTMAALVNTDKKLVTWQQGPGLRTLATLRDCPQALTPGTEQQAAIYFVLALQDCSSASPRVIRVDAAGNARGSVVLEAGGNDIAFAAGRAWVVNGSGSVSIVDGNSLELIALIGDVPRFAWKIEAGEGAVFVGGKTRQEGGSPSIARLDPAAMTTTNLVVLPGTELILAMAVTDGLLVVVGSEGTIWVLRASDLQTLRVATADTGAFEPHAALVIGDRLYVTVHSGAGENGSVLVFSGWRP